MQFTTLGIEKSIGPKEWPIYQGHVTHDPIVHDGNSFAAARIANSRAITVAPGGSVAFGHDVSSTGVDTIIFPKPATGGQWHMIALERRYSANGGPVTTTLVRMEGAATTDKYEDGTPAEPGGPPGQAPTGWTEEPGRLFHQALWWCWVSSAHTFVILYDERRVRSSTIPTSTHALAYGRRYLPEGRLAGGRTAVILDLEPFWTPDAEIVDVNVVGLWEALPAGPAGAGPGAGIFSLVLNDYTISLTVRHFQQQGQGKSLISFTGRGVSRVGFNKVQFWDLLDPTSADCIYTDVKLEALRH